MSAHYALYIFEPGSLQKVISGEMTLSSELAMAETLTNWLIPLTMAFLSTTLGRVATRRLNLVLGGIFTVLGIFHLMTCPIVHIYTNPSIHQSLISISTIVVTALIFWYAYKWPK
jgi:hypothetical protein